ncbi:YgiQ family radical SAM protein [Accumulibacter sp.]|uniref:YgiQ family radical SAM protein n=1 Tax=Accumulibacter sp. TaxID=2053492 RepID=UPI0025FAEDFE|nr:YgiQ family radical SAM protein [Accumulibacter sp.]MCM8594581.1 YgiQ family radical SAM protein [Accumulibacter sp.]MCM8627429.1 YgiQ family radical SAM protein [Accumulibacter sp.]MDS4048727.1 YgiQ family radical SAM protein [Accumulibacter sp.]
MNCPAHSPAAAAPRPLFSYRKYWPSRFGVAPFLPMSRAEMDDLGWDACDVIIVSGDAYVDHPSFGMALIGRLLEAQGFLVGIISQPDWRSADAFRALGRPKLFFGVTAGNMDSMVNRYTADRKPRSDDAYTPDGAPDRRPDRAVVVYAQRCREAYAGVNVVIGSIEASLRRIAHYDYWSDKVRRSVLPDSKADLLIYGSAERAVVELAHRLAAGEPIGGIRDLRGTAFMVARGWLPGDDWVEVDSTVVDAPGPPVRHADPYAATTGSGADCAREAAPREQPISVDFGGLRRRATIDRARTAIRLPAYEQVATDPVLYAHASRVFHLEANPGNARALIQAHGARDVWLNPPPIPLSTAEIDGVFASPFQRRPHPAYGEARIPAFEMIRFSVNIMRGCFGGCTFCSITEHEGRIIQSRSEQSIVREIEEIRDRTPGFTGVISDLGGPTANMYRMACRDPQIESACRRLSCVYPGICANLNTDHAPLVELYRKARSVPGVKKVLIASGLRYDLAVRDPRYVRELVTHHVGGYLKVAPEHTEERPLSYMMKPRIAAWDEFRALFEKYSKEAGKEQYLIPYFIAAHPGTTDEDMLRLALWLKRNQFRLDQVQTFLPTPLALATAMYHSRRNPLRKVAAGSEVVETARSAAERRLHKAFLRYHDPDNWPLLREALRRMGRAELIGNGRQHLVPHYQPPGTGKSVVGAAKASPGSASRPGGSTRGVRRPARPGRID